MYRSQQFAFLVAVSIGAAWTLFTQPVAAQDFDAVERRLAEAVAEGELSLKQAAIMMETLKETASSDEGKDHGDVVLELEAWIKDVAHKLEVAAEKGEIDKATALKKWQHFLHEEVGPKFKALVQSGELDEEKAAQWWKAMTKGQHGAEQTDGQAKGGDAMTHYVHWIGKVGGELKQAVADGKLDEETAHKKWRHFKEQELAPKLKAAVEAGKLDEKSATALWQKLEAAEAHKKGDADKQEIDWQAVKDRIEGTVKSGKLTREQANQAYEKLKKGAAQR